MTFDPTRRTLAALALDWHVADKSGSGVNGTRNDVGILHPPSGAPIVLSVLYAGALTPIANKKIITRCADIVVRALA